MKGIATTRLLLILLALSSLLTTGLITLVMLKRQQMNIPVPQDMPGIGEADDSLLMDGPMDLPAFSLLDSAGEPFGNEQLRGKVSIVSFIFTRCPGMCPAITSQFAVLQQRLANTTFDDDIQLISISVDPDHDTPDVMAERARLARADPDQWHWVTGQRDAVRSLIRDGFKLVAEEATDPNAAEPIIHSGKFVLLDRQGRIRGYYDGLDAASRHAMWNDMRRLLESAGGGSP